MLLNCGVGEDSWESVELQGDPTSPFWRRSALGFFGRNDAKAETSILWPPHVKSWLIGKDSDAGRNWGQEEKGTTEDEMAGWHHWLNGRESEWTPGVGDREAWRAAIHGSQRVGHDWATDLIWSVRWSLSVHVTAVRETGVCSCHKENVPMQRADYTSLCHNFCPSVHTPMPDCRCLSCSWQRLLKIKVKVLVAQSCPTLCNLIDCSPPG